MNAYFHQHRRVVVGAAVAACLVLALGLAFVATSCVNTKSGIAGSGGCTINAELMADVTVSDGTQLAGGTAFVKTWRMKNSGTCAWEQGTQLIYVSGDPLGGPTAVGVSALAAGATTDVSVNFVAPATPGTYRSNWHMQSPGGAQFGPEVHVQIVVPGPASATATITSPPATPTPTSPPPTATPKPTPTPTPAPTSFGGGNGRIAYASNRDGNFEIYTMGASDAAPTRLTTSPEIDGWPHWSSDGKRIAFEREQGSKPDIYVMNADGSAQVNLTNNPAYDTDPAWSPDGTHIVFGSDRVGGVLQIWTIKSDGTGPVQLTSTPQLNDSPAWSPDGSRIAFESQRDGQREIYVMNANGTGQTRLTHTGNNYAPQWSPDGSKIAFSGSNGIWEMKADGTGLKQLTTNPASGIYDLHPTWSPDGSKLAFDSNRSGNFDIWAVNADGTGLQQLTSNAAADLEPSWR